MQILIRVAPAPASAPAAVEVEYSNGGKRNNAPLSYTPFGYEIYVVHFMT